MVDKKAFRELSYGLYLVSSIKDGKPVGCVVNTFAQVTSEPAQVSIAINKENYTTQGILESGMFEAVVLGESAPMELIGAFGFHSSADTDKFAAVPFATSEQGIPYVNQNITAHFSVKVSQQLDLGSHLFFVGEVVAAERFEGEPSMTYAYYHAVKGGKTPPKASSYNPEDQEVAASSERKFAWRCTVCGHIEYVDELPEGYTCPVCGVGADKFERIEL